MITLEMHYGAALIKINGTTHLMFKTDRFVGFQSWIEEDRFCIETTLDGGAIRTEYDSPEKMKAVIDAIERAVCSGRQQLAALQESKP